MGDVVECRSIRYAAFLSALAAVALAVSAAFLSTAFANETAGDRMVRALRANTVAIRAEWKEDEQRADGFGFITAVEGGATYVVTADHVVRSPDGDRTADTVSVRFFGSRQPVAAEVLKAHDSTLDIAVISRQRNARRETGSAPRAVRTGKRPRGTKVWFIGRSGTWYTPATPGTVNYVDPDLGLVIEGLSVTVGTSGAPLISEEGIVGLMTTDAAGDLSRACPIRDVRKRIRSWKIPWALVPPNLADLSPGTQLSAQAIADAARLAERMGNFQRAGTAAPTRLRCRPQEHVGGGTASIGGGQRRMATMFPE